MAEIAQYKDTLLTFNPLFEPVAQTAIDALQLPGGSHGLDAGCGIGLQAQLLAQAVGSGGRVTALDIEPAFLRHGQELAEAAGLGERIIWQQGDVRRLDFDDRTFDWAWSSCCVGYASFLEPVSTLREMARVVRPGGIVAILVWSSERLLPGYPRLEARLQATAAGLAPFEVGQEPQRHWQRALGWLRAVPLEQCTARSFIGEAQAPLSKAMRQALRALLEMRWPGAEAELAPEDRAEFERLCRPESPGFILHLDDYYGFFTCTLFWGRRPDGAA